MSPLHHVQGMYHALGSPSSSWVFLGCAAAEWRCRQARRATQVHSITAHWMRYCQPRRRKAATKRRRRRDAFGCDALRKRSAAPRERYRVLRWPGYGRSHPRIERSARSGRQILQKRRSARTRPFVSAGKVSQSQKRRKHRADGISGLLSSQVHCTFLRSLIGYSLLPLPAKAIHLLFACLPACL